jgi:hypothetical protein
MFDCDINIFVGVSHFEYSQDIPGPETRFVVKLHKPQPKVGSGLSESLRTHLMHRISNSGTLWSFRTSYNSKYYEKMTADTM